MNPISLQITFNDGTKVDALASATDFIAFETKYDKSIQSFATDARITYMFFLAWNALKRTKKTDLDFEDWVDTVQNLEVADPKA